MDNNILYVGVNMLDMLEAVKDNSKDFILLFMPPNMGGTVGDTALRPVIDKETSEKWYHKSNVIDAYIDVFSKRRDLDYGGRIFFDKKDFDEYIDFLKKVLQNCKRILKSDGVLCFGKSMIFGYIYATRDEKADTKLLLEQLFSQVTITCIPNFSIDSNPNFAYNDIISKYDLFVCSNRALMPNEKNIRQNLKLPNSEKLLWDIYDDPKWVEETEKWYFTDVEVETYNHGAKEIRKEKRDTIAQCSDEMFAINKQTILRDIFVPELRWACLGILAARSPELTIKEIEPADKVTSKVLSYERWLRSNEKCGTLTRTKTTVDRTKKRLLKAAVNPKNLTPLVKGLMLTFCKKGDSVLFPYDRNAQYAAFADELGMNWTSLLKKSLSAGGKLDTQFVLKLMLDSKYDIRKKVPVHPPISYRKNLVSSIADANLITTQLTKYTDLMSQVVQCASDNGWGNNGDMEDAVHALISLAVKSHAGSIVGDEAEKWFGEGWKLLSAQCKNYLQTAAAYDKISQQNGNADCAPIGIEFYRALEHELNSTLVNDLFAYIKENSERVKEILENTEQSNDMKRIASTMSAILNDETVRGLTLGEIYQSLKAAAASSDKDVGDVIAECCRERGYANLLSHDNVGCLGMAAQLRNLCAHPSNIDGSFMGLNLQIVRRTLKEQQVQAESQCDNNMPSVCAIIGPDNNKMKYPEDTTNMKAAIKSLILMFYKSGIRQYASTGNSGFDLLVGEVLKECRQSSEAKSIKVTEYLPCERDKMKFAPNRKKRVLAIDKFATIEVCGDADNATNRGACQEKALENAVFCIAFYAEDGQSAIANRVKDAMQKGTIVYNTYGIV